MTNLKGLISVWQPGDLCTRCGHAARDHRSPETPFGPMPCPEGDCVDWRGP